MTPPALSAVLTLACAALLLAAPATHAAEPQGVRRFALVIGANDGGHDRIALRYAVSDARAMAAVLEGLGGVPTADRLMLEEPDAASILAAFEALGVAIRRARDAHRRTELVVYYSGHSDEYGLLLGGARMPYGDLRRAIEATPADVKIAIVDACASGALLRKKGGRRVRPFLVDVATDVSGQAFLTSSAADEVAQESDRIGASFFTHHLVSGLRGAADTSGDGRVTLVEAYQFAFEETLARTEHTQGGPQHANYDFDLTGSGDIVITDLRAMGSSLSLGAALSGRFFVRDASERLVAEVRKHPGRAVTLGLEAGIYQVATVSDGQILSATVSLPSGGGATVEARHLVARGPVASHRARGGPGWAPTFDEAADHGPPPTVIVTTGRPTIPSDAASGRVSLIGPLAFPAVDYVDGFSFGILGDHLEGLSGYQLSTLYNVVHGDMEGLQQAGVVNVTGGFVEGVQLAGVANVAGDVDGAQIGLVNIAGHVSGAQIGLFNYADSVDGVSLGLIPIVGDGYNVVELWADTTFMANASLRLGAPALHVILSGGATDLAGSDRCVLRLGGGVGSHVEAGPLYLDIDGMAWALAGDGCDVARIAETELLAAGRVTLGVPITRGFALFIGGAANFELALNPDEDLRPLLDRGDGRRGPDGNFDVRFFPSFFAGVRLL